MKNLFVFENYLCKKKHKAYCLQSYFGSICIYNYLNCILKVFEDSCTFFFHLNFLGDVFKFQISLTKRTDHAGFTFDLSILGFSFVFMIYDTRHWNVDCDEWENYD